MLLPLALLAAQTADPAPSTPPADPPLLCRREEVTGSRLGGRRRCMTRADWDAEADAARRTHQDLVTAGAQTQTRRD